MKQKLIQEIVGGDPYEYIPLGKHVVSVPRICRGRPTFKYTRIEVTPLLETIAGGYPVEKLIRGYAGRVSKEAIEEAAALAS